MKITNLIENTPGENGCHCQHGLSFYIETAGHRLLSDTGASGAFLENAEALGVDLTRIDMVILSHGHYDHAGGILSFAALNPGAAILMQRSATGNFYHKTGSYERYIGIAPEIGELPQVRYLEGDVQIDDEVSLFTGVTGRRLWPSGNQELMTKENGHFRQDDFRHEQYLVLTENEKHTLISGCAHNGILNILDRFRELYGTDPARVISGFHMQKKTGYTQKDLDEIRQTALELKTMDTVFYTGHCTGEIPFRVLREILEDQLLQIHSGQTV